MLPPALRSLVRTTPTIAPVPHRALLSVTGSHAKEFLSGIVASTVPPSPDYHFYTAFLHAQGRVIHDAFIHAHTSPEGKKGYLIEYDARQSEAPSLLAMLKRYVLRSKVRIRDVSDEYQVWSVWGTEREQRDLKREWNPARSGVVEPVWAGSGEGSWPWGSERGTLWDNRATGMGHRLIVKQGELPSQHLTHDTAAEDDYVLHRILHGVPEGSTDIVPMHSFPIDSNLDLMGALDFRKGCYVGQELTVRTYHTGIIRKRIFPVLLEPHNTSSLSSIPPGTDVQAVRSATPTDGTPKARPRGTGKILSSTKGVALALLRLEHVSADERGDVTLKVDLESQDSSWVVKPWRPDWWPELPSTA